MMEIARGLIIYLLLMISLSLREWARGFVARWMGDYTPVIAGRLTLNPLAHIDLFGTVVLPLSMILFFPGFVIFGWAKPMPINPNYFKDSRLGELLVGISGAVMNLLLAIIAGILGAICVKIFGIRLGSLFGMMMWANLALFVFNLIPIPPMDGSYVVKFLFKVSNRTFYQIAQYSALIIILLIEVPIIRRFILGMMIGLFGVINDPLCSLFGIPENALFP